MIERRRPPYPSDVSDHQWREIAPLLYDRRPQVRGPSTPLREVANGINYRWTTGCVWRMLPHDFPPWQTVYFYFRRWLRDGRLLRLREVLLHRPSRRDAA